MESALRAHEQSLRCRHKNLLIFLTPSFPLGRRSDRVSLLLIGAISLFLGGSDDPLATSPHSGPPPTGQIFRLFPLADDLCLLFFPLVFCFFLLFFLVRALLESESLFEQAGPTASFFCDVSLVSDYLAPMSLLFASRSGSTPPLRGSPLFLLLDSFFFSHRYFLDGIESSFGEPRFRPTPPPGPLL